MTTLGNNALDDKWNLAPAELQAQLLRNHQTQLVDVREYPEFASGRISGARLFPLSELAQRSVELDRSKPLVLMCRSGKRSQQGLQTLLALGFTKIQQLNGGFLAWEKAGLPVEKDARAPWALERQVRLTAGLLVLVGLGGSLLWPPAVGLSWFVGAGLVWAALTDWCGMGLLLARMPWNNPTNTSTAKHQA